MSDEVWLIVGVPVYPKGVGWGWGQTSVQAGQVQLHQTGKTVALWTARYGGNPNHEEQPQTKRVSVVYFYYTDLCINSARLFSPYIWLLNIECKLTLCTLSVIKTSSTGKCCSLPFSVLTGSPCDPFSPGLPGKPCMWSKGKWINRQNE